MGAPEALQAAVWADARAAPTVQWAGKEGAKAAVMEAEQDTTMTGTQQVIRPESYAALRSELLEGTGGDDEALPLQVQQCLRFIDSCTDFGSSALTLVLGIGTRTHSEGFPNPFDFFRQTMPLWAPENGPGSQSGNSRGEAGAGNGAGLGAQETAFSENSR